MQKNCLFECLNVTCFALFLLQMGFLINNHLHPDETISHTEQKRLSENSLSTIYRVCIKPIMQLYFACKYIITFVYFLPRLSDISFPVVFRICIKPAFDLAALWEAGYSSSWQYFAGLSTSSHGLIAHFL